MITTIENYVDRLHDKYPLISKPDLLKICKLFLKQFVRFTKLGYFISTDKKDFFFSTTFDTKSISAKKFVLNEINKQLSGYKKLTRLMIINEKSNHKYISRRIKSRQSTHTDTK